MIIDDSKPEKGNGGKAVGRNVLLLTVLNSMLPFFSYCWNSQIHSTVVRTLQNGENSMETYAKTVTLCLVCLEGHLAPFTPHLWDVQCF